MKVFRFRINDPYTNNYQWGLGEASYCRIIRGIRNSYHRHPLSEFMPKFELSFSADTHSWILRVSAIGSRVDLAITVHVCPNSVCAKSVT